MKKDYKRQIVDYNIEKFNLMVKDDINIFLSTELLTQTNNNTILQVNSVSNGMKIRKELK